MIEHLRSILKADGIETRQKALMGGFSASGMFVNRFTLLHPDRVLGAAIGSPGGWPVAPVVEHMGELLPFPAGIADLSSLTGIEIDLATYRKLPQFFFVGALDDNDSVTYRDGWDAEDAERVNRLFGSTLLSRWSHAQMLYRAAEVSAEFRIYEGVGHSINDAMANDMLRFFRKCLETN
jgi:pimeloyl-ACP methyl ester carboxylesterase